MGTRKALWRRLRRWNSQCEEDPGIQKPHDLRVEGLQWVQGYLRNSRKSMLTGIEQVRGSGQRGGGVQGYIPKDIHVRVRRRLMMQEAQELFCGCISKTQYV